jgi:hypothetical protein
MFSEKQKSPSRGTARRGGLIEPDRSLARPIAVKRFLIFLLLGPLIGYGVALALLGMLFVAPLMAIGLAYLLGVLPALLVALLDWFLAPRLGFAKRVLVCSIAGFLASPILIMGLLADPAMGIFFGAPGVVAAFACSLLSGRYVPPRATAGAVG